MEHRISAGVFVENDGKILLVRHVKQGVYDFWVAPGGGAVGGEDLRATARREALEECGLEVAPGRLLYVQEFTQPGVRHCKLWFQGELRGGTLRTDAPEAVREHIVEAGWFGPDELTGKIVFPPMLADHWTTHRSAATAEYVGLREMAFY